MLDPLFVILQDTVKYNNELTSEVCSSGNESVLHQESIALEEPTDLLQKSEQESEETRLTKKMKEIECKSSEQSAQIKSLHSLKDSSPFTPKVFLQSEEQILDKTLTGKNLRFVIKGN